jgi:hypothetical protein
MHRTRVVVLIGVFALLVGNHMDKFTDYFESTYADYVGIVAGVYCRAPAELRDTLRQIIDANTAPNKIRVECAADAL